MVQILVSRLDPASSRRIQEGSDAQVAGDHLVPEGNVTFAVVNDGTELGVVMKVVHQVLHAADALFRESGSFRQFCDPRDRAGAQTHLGEVDNLVLVVLGNGSAMCQQKPEA